MELPEPGQDFIGVAPASADPLPNDSHTAILTQSSREVGEKSKTVYTRRWFVILSAALLNLSSALIWNSFATAAASTKEYYQVSFGAVNMLSLVFMIISIPFGFVAIWALDSLGLRFSLLGAAVLNGIGGVLRLLSVFSFVPFGDKYSLLLAGQCIAALGQPFLMFCPPKIAQFWFPENERAIANTIVSMANPLGIMLSAVLSPTILDEHDMMALMITYTVPAVVGLIVAALSVTRSRPLVPPSDSADQDSEPFLQGLKKLLTNRMFLILAFCFGSGMAIFTGLAALILQILCPYGFGEKIAGTTMGVMIGAGLVGAAVTGAIVDKTKLFEEVAKFSLGFAGVFFCLFSVVLVLPHDLFGDTTNHAGVLIFLAGGFGFFGFGQYSVCLEMSLETTFPVAEAATAGLMVTCGQVLAAVTVLVMQAAGFVVDDKFKTCSDNATLGGDVLNYTYGNIYLESLAIVAGMILVWFYKCPYKRLTFEREHKKRMASDVNNS